MWLFVAALMAPLAPVPQARPIIVAPGPLVHYGTSRTILEQPGPPERITRQRTSRVHAPTTPTIRGRCPQFEDLLAEYAPPEGWDVATMSALMYRESRCQPGVHTSCCWGLFEIHTGHDAALTAELGTLVDPTTLVDPVTNVRAAAALCHARRVRGGSCYADWGR